MQMLFHVVFDTVAVTLDEADWTLCGAFNVISAHTLLILEEQVIVTVLEQAALAAVTCIVTILTVYFNVVQK